MTKSTTKPTPKTAETSAPVVFFTKSSTGAKSGSTTAKWNSKLRRLTIPASYRAGVKAYTVTGADGGVDALLLQPTEADGGRKVHPSQGFITIPADLSAPLKSERYEIDGEGGGDLVLYPKGSAKPTVGEPETAEPEASETEGDA